MTNGNHNAAIGTFAAISAIMAPMNKAIERAEKKIPARHLESEQFGEVTVVYRSHYEEGREVVSEIDGYEVQGKPMTAAEVDAAGFIVPDEQDLQNRLDDYAHNANLP